MNDQANETTGLTEANAPELSGETQAAPPQVNVDVTANAGTSDLATFTGTPGVDPELIVPLQYPVPSPVLAKEPQDRSANDVMLLTLMERIGKLEKDFAAMRQAAARRGIKF